MPPFDSFPKSAWRGEVLQGYEFYRQSQRSDLVVPPQELVVSLFESRAPQQLELPDVPGDESSPALVFQPEHQPLSGITELPALAHLQRVPLSSGGPPSLVYCDMFSGEVGALPLGTRVRTDAVLADLANPCHVAPCDLDGDGVLDLIVADLGSFTPGDHDHGRVVWLRRDSADAPWKASMLLSGVGRVADVQPADFDGDGDLDLIVAEFGWRKRGRILLLENRATSPARAPEFQVHEVDSRHGTIHVPVIDLNQDGRPDFVALISQEHETIEAFFNEGGGTFRRETIYAAANPSFGSTGIQLVDLDGDGDTDVLYTNGDAMDSYVVKPYHGVQWLENTGTFPFQHHHLAALPGAARALADDLDGDGLPDVAAVAFLPDHVLAAYPETRFDSLIWLKQGPHGEFSRHRIERGNLQHISLELVDVDGDGLVDICTGNFAGSPDRTGPRLTVWRHMESKR